MEPCEYGQPTVMLWVAVGVGAALVLLLIVSLTGRKTADEPAPAMGTATPPKAIARKESIRPPGAALRTGGRTGGGRDDDEAEPEGTKVASVPPPQLQKGVVTDLAASDPYLEGTPSTTVSIDVEGLEDDDPTGPQALILVTAIGRTDAGRRRKHNEDSYLTMPEQSLFVIADGMGGYAAGEVASQLAVDVIAESFKTKTFVGDPDASRPRRGDELVRAIGMANTAILTQARANEAQHGMGTTLVSCRFSPNKQRVYIAHVGDSRCYRIREGQIKQLTQDHTLGAAGITGPAAAKLSRAVGIQDTVEVDLEIDAPRDNDHYILCSDGLSKMVPDEMIRDLVLGERDLDKGIAKLIETANERGGRDNISVILIRVQTAAGKSASKIPAG
jgi:serine/threonine protein phosphatase PrpC